MYKFPVRDVWKAVRGGHYGDGVLRWVGKHHITAMPRVGVERNSYHSIQLCPSMITKPAPRAVHAGGPNL